MNQKGMSIVELLIAVLISSIVFFGLVVPFIADRSFWGAGRRQAQAQRDAQLALHTIARYGHESAGYTWVGSGGQYTIAFNVPCPGVTPGPGVPIGTGTVVFQTGPSFNKGRFDMVDNCSGGKRAILIDGVRSKVTNFVVTPISSGNLVTVKLKVTYENQMSETLQTQVFMHNS